MSSTSQDSYEGFRPFLTAALGHVLSLTADPNQGETFPEAAEDAVSDLEDRLDAAAANCWAARNRFESVHGQAAAASFRALDTMAGCVFATGQLLSEQHAAGAAPPEPVPYVIAALTTRAVSVTHDICALLRAGLTVGARARWRTLYEIDVIANVLAAGNRGTAARFVNHRCVQIEKDLRRQGSAPSDLRLAQSMKARYMRRYGSSFGGTYGWAAEITRRRLKVTSPRFSDLERIADLYGHVERHHYAHHAVHGSDALGPLHLLDESGRFHSGATFGGIGGGVLETTRVLGEINDALLRMWESYVPSEFMSGLRALNDELSLLAQRASYWEAGGT